MAASGSPITLLCMETGFSLGPTEEQQQILDAVRRMLTDCADPLRGQEVIGGLDALGLVGAQLGLSNGGMGQDLPTMTLLHEELGLWRVPPEVLEATVLWTDSVHHHDSGVPNRPRGIVDQSLWSSKPLLRGVFDAANETWILSGQAVLRKHAPEGLEVLLMFEGSDGHLMMSIVEGAPVFVSDSQIHPMQPDLCTVALNQVAIADSEVFTIEGDKRPRWAVLRAAELVGWSQSVLDQCVTYVQQREQFGGPIGRFQAIQHTLARMLVSIEAARSAVYGAACLIEIERALDQIWGHAAQAVLEALEAARFCTQEAIQVHGGMGYTVDCGLDKPLMAAFEIEAQLHQIADWHKAIRT